MHPENLLTTAYVTPPPPLGDWDADIDTGSDNKENLLQAFWLKLRRLAWEVGRELDVN